MNSNWIRIEFVIDSYSIGQWIIEVSLTSILHFFPFFDKSNITTVSTINSQRDNDHFSNTWRIIPLKFTIYARIVRKRVIIQLARSGSKNELMQQCSRKMDGQAWHRSTLGGRFSIKITSRSTRRLSNTRYNREGSPPPKASR